MFGDLTPPPTGKDVTSYTATEFLALIRMTDIRSSFYDSDMILNLMIGVVTPPVGVVLYVVSNVAKVPFERVTKATIPFLIPLLITLALVTFVPAITTIIPNLIFGGIG